MSRHSNMSAWVLPFVVVSVLMNVPGMVGEGPNARLMFMIIGILTWIVAEIYDRRSATVIGTVLDVASYSLKVFFSESMRSTRICVSVTTAICTIYSITQGGYWTYANPPFPVGPLFMVSTIWAVIELFMLTTEAVENWYIRRNGQSNDQGSYNEHIL